MEIKDLLPYLSCLVIPWVVWLHKSIYEKIDRSEVNEMIDLKLQEIKAVQSAHKDIILEMRQGIRDINIKVDYLITRIPREDE